MGLGDDGKTFRLADEDVFRINAKGPRALGLADRLKADRPNGTQASSSSRRAIVTPLSDIQREQVEWLDPGRVPLGLVTVLAGVGGLGKSQWTCQLAARLSRGELGEPGVTLLATAEDSYATTVRPRMEAAGGNTDLIHAVAIQTGDGLEDGIAIPDDMEEIAARVAELHVRLLVVDPLVAHLPAEIDSHKDQSVRRALAPLYRLAHEQSCAVVCVVHLNKSQGLQPLMRLSGSAGFGNAARSVLLLDRDPDDPDGEEGSQRVLAHVKCNIAPLAQSLLYQVAPILLPAVDGQPKVETSRLELLGESPHNGRTLLASVSDEERSATDEAEEFLQAELGDGARQPADRIYKAARKVGISDRTLRRAGKNLGVQREKAGFGRGWEWWLEPASAPVFAKRPRGLATSEAGDVWPLRETHAESGVARFLGDPKAAEGARIPRLAPSGDSPLSETPANGVTNTPPNTHEPLFAADLGTVSLDELHRRHERGEL